MARKTVFWRKPREGVMAREAMASGGLINTLDEKRYFGARAAAEVRTNWNVIQNQ